MILKKLGGGGKFNFDVKYRNPWDSGRSLECGSGSITLVQCRQYNVCAVVRADKAPPVSTCGYSTGSPPGSVLSSCFDSVYQVEVTTPNGRYVRVEKRYSAFLSLHKVRRYR